MSRENAALRQKHLQGGLKAESLMDKGVLRASATGREVVILPDVEVVGIGGGSIMDRGATAILPLVAEIARLKKRHNLVIGVSGGARTRHVFKIALDLGLPTGGLAHLAGASEEQNMKMLQALLAKHGGISMTKDHFWDLPHKLASGMIPIMIGMPPYHYWEQPPRRGRLPMNGSDFGLFVFAETIGARRVVYLKDQDGQHEADPQRVPRAKLLRRVSAQELLRLPDEDLIVERMVLETMLCARHVREIVVANGLKPGALSKALSGRTTGTVIYAAKEAGR